MEDLKILTLTAKTFTEATPAGIKEWRLGKRSWYFAPYSILVIVTLLVVQISRVHTSAYSGLTFLSHEFKGCHDPLRLFLDPDAQHDTETSSER